MVAHTEPVESWGYKPCGESASPITTCVSAGCGVPRPTGIGRGMPEVQTLLNSALIWTYGGRQNVAGLADRRATNEQQSSQAAASTAKSFAMAPSYEGDYSYWTSGVLPEDGFPPSRLTDDLGTAFNE